MWGRAFLSLLFARFIVLKNNRWKNNAVKAQRETMLRLLNQAKNTAFGKDHCFAEIKSYADFKDSVPIRDYEGFKPYVEQIINGGENVLWPGRPLYFCKPT